MRIRIELCPKPRTGRRRPRGLVAQFVHDLVHILQHSRLLVAQEAQQQQRSHTELMRRGIPAVAL
jgi:hypothetical protein